ncbi:MAG: dipeptide epimerase, partial [Pyrinomonadaceae bacterium]|nr:dipeptide epimerase [Pyrinomonadaceae bacterium]
LHDLAGKKLGKPAREIYGRSSTKPIATSFTIGIDSARKMVQKALEAKEFKTLKIKLNGENDLEVVSAIAEVTDQRLFVDANQAWTEPEEALETSRSLIKLGVELIEQPFAKGAWEKAKLLKENLEVPVIADEDVLGFSDIKKLSEYYDGINIKLMKCGGLHEAFRMTREARACGMKILLGCMTESSIGISAASQLAGFVDWCDLDGNLLIKNDTCQGIRCVDGLLIPEETSGIGITDDRKLRELLTTDSD